MQGAGSAFEALVPIALPIVPLLPPFLCRSATKPATPSCRCIHVRLPDHNPSEYLNNDLKQKLRQQPQSGSEQELIKRTRSVLRVIQCSPERVRAYFRPEPVRYAA